jgi:hypothetical protein
MEDFEKLGQFYLGRRYDPAAGRLLGDLVLYDSKDLVTHGVCVGMTGSGKTGLCMTILEEAAIDRIPALVIDPKGDMGNLLLNFPNLSAAEFLPWVNAEDAARLNQAVDQYAAGQAEVWKRGLEEWNQDGRRILKLRESADFTIYTPGSSSGMAISVLNSFACPAAALLEDREAVADLITSATTALLGLIGVSGDPIKSREHILISNIIQFHWSQGQDVDLASLIRSIQTPPFQRVGAFDTDSFFPSKERFEFALALNNLLAAPGFAAWLEGEALDVGRLLHTAEGRPRVSILSIAHLSDAERMFFVTLLLNQVIAWMRTQPGTTSLRALVYMDEVAGYLPPVAEPPSKRPLMLLFKQARAFGVGVLLATQNPVDLDYKALSNAGTWFVGRLQTAQDVDRLVQGIGSGGAGQEFDLRKSISTLGKRVFLMKNIHDDAPEVFQTRWCLSYLRGPLTLTQIKQLSASKKSAMPAPGEAGPAAVTPALAEAASGRPSLPPQIPEFFVPFRGIKPSGAKAMYKPVLCGAGDVHFSAGQDVHRVFVADIGDTALSVNWDASQRGGFDDTAMDREPESPAEYAPLAGAAYKAENYKLWARDFADFLYRTCRLDLYRSPDFKLTSNPGESEGEFRIRLSQLAREKRDKASDAMRAKYAAKISALEDRIRRAEQRLLKEKADVRQAGIQTVVSIGATLLGAFMGRKTLSTGNIGRASTAVRKGMQTARERSDIESASENLDVLRQQRAELESEFNAEMKTLEATGDPALQKVEVKSEAPRKTDVNVRLVALVWLPHWKTPEGEIRPAFS